MLPQSLESASKKCIFPFPSTTERLRVIPEVQELVELVHASLTYQLVELSSSSHFIHLSQQLVDMVCKQPFLIWNNMRLALLGGNFQIGCISEEGFDCLNELFPYEFLLGIKLIRLSTSMLKY
ncbi:hypothetical protein Tco_1412148 [Tanacetum coccineum]